MSTLDTLRGSGPLWTASLILDRIVPLGVLRLWPKRTVSPEILSDQLHRVLDAWGVPPEHAAVVVDHMLFADLSGIDSEGCAMLLHYDRGRSDASLTMAPTLEVVREGETTAVVDGGGGLGHVAGDMAMGIAIEKCRAFGVGAVATRNSGHFGATGIYASKAAESGFIGIATTSTREPALVPTFGAEPVLGTNPIAFAAPAGDDGFTLDMATSTASIGGVWTAWRAGRMIPAGWSHDGRGRSIRSARRAARERRLTPLGATRRMGSHKGYGLALAMEILSSVVTGSWQKKATPSSPRAVGHFFLAIDPGRFREDGGFESDLAAMLATLRAATPVDSRRPVLVAGDPERAERAERSHAGIPLARAVVEDIRAVARAAKVPFLLDRA
jgi:LDH2 family malate/lactate/ureidoglycolate dehydrogenase